MSLFGLKPAGPGITAYWSYWANGVECFATSPGAALIVISFGDYFVFGTGGGTAVGDGQWLTDVNSKQQMYWPFWPFLAGDPHCQRMLCSRSLPFDGKDSDSQRAAYTRFRSIIAAKGAMLELQVTASRKGRSPNKLHTAAQIQGHTTTSMYYSLHVSKRAVTLLSAQFHAFTEQKKHPAGPMLCAHSRPKQSNHQDNWIETRTWWNKKWGKSYSTCCRLTRWSF